MGNLDNYLLLDEQSIINANDMNVIWCRSGIPHDLVFFGAEEQFKNKFLGMLNQGMYNPSGGDEVECIN